MCSDVLGSNRVDIHDKTISEKSISPGCPLCGGSTLDKIARFNPINTEALKHGGMEMIFIVVGVSAQTSATFEGGRTGSVELGMYIIQL